MKDLGFAHGQSDPCSYSKYNGNKICLIALYVDDVLICSNDEKMLNNVKKQLFERYKMKDLGIV